MMKHKVVVLTSGGIDSCALNALLMMYDLWDVYPIFFGYQQLSEKRELMAASDFLVKVGVKNELTSCGIRPDFLQIPMTGHGRMPLVTDKDFQQTKHLDWVPHRNLIFLTVAAQYASVVGTSMLAIGSHKEELYPHPDSARPFLDVMEKALTLSDGKKHQWKILTPFVYRGWYKWDVVKWCKENNLPLELTWTCYQGKKKHCGVCRGCYDRKQAFKKAGVKDRTEYLQ